MSGRDSLVLTVGSVLVYQQYVPAFALVLCLGALYLLFNRRQHVLSHIPSVGSTGLLTSYLEAFKYFVDAPGILRNNHETHKSRIFRVAQLDRWVVIASNEKHIQELSSAPDDSLSFTAAVEEVLQAKYTLGFRVNEHLFPVIRSRLTRNLGKLFPAVRDEIAQAFKDYITPGDGSEQEWQTIHPFDTITRIVSRTSSRVFVGFPTCRDVNYNNLCIRFTADVMAGSTMINCFPTSLKWLAALIFNRAPRTTRKVYKILKPIIDERRQGLTLFGTDWEHKPNDLLTWLMEDEHSRHDDAWELTKKIMAINFTAIHTSSVSLTHALFHLVSQPHYIDILREEIDEVVQRDGWTKQSVAQMRKLDSFLKEAQRMNGPGAMSLFRKAIKTYTLSDGTVIPVGTLVLGASTPVHFDDAIYQNASSFDGMRFYDKGPDAMNQMVTPSLNFLSFGYGKMACPGRFFAVAEIKTILAHLIHEYDLKLKDGVQRPKDHWVGTACVPNMKAKLLMRRRISE